MFLAEAENETATIPITRADLLCSRYLLKLSSSE